MKGRDRNTWGFIWRRRALIRTLTFVITTATSSGITPSLAMPPHEQLGDRIARGELAVPRMHMHTPWDPQRPVLAAQRAGGGQPQLRRRQGESARAGLADP